MECIVGRVPLENLLAVIIRSTAAVTTNLSTSKNPSERCHPLKICENYTLHNNIVKKKSKISHESCPPLDFDDVEEDECKAEIHVKKRDLPLLVEVLQLPPTFTCHQRSVYMGLCMLLRRAAFRVRYSYMITR